MPEEAVKEAVSSEWFERAVRFGHAAKAAVFGVIGVMAARLALGDRDETPDFVGAMESMANRPLDVLFLGVLSLGLFAYAGWRIAVALLNLHDRKNGVSGLLSRGTMFAAGVTYAFFGVYAIALLAGMRRDDESIDDETATVMSWPFGEWIVGAVAVGFVAAGAREVFVAFTGRYRDEFRNVRLHTAEKWLVHASGWWGHAARGAIYIVAGVYGVRAAWNYDADEAKGFAEALGEIGSGPWGVWLLLFIAAGLAAFGAYSLLLAIHRHVPDADGTDGPREERLP
ncbi:MAG TPA: DUF1206 domain-containing protein [Longimicrobiales bacterium]|nr:DUF1206 domain-containing protein [Longimicrobiales bacterium]